MDNGWYYARNDKKLGPYSQQQLKELASAGTILRTDTIWRGDRSVQADRVKNLFAAIVMAPVAPALQNFDEIDVPRLVPLDPFVKVNDVPLDSVPPASAPAAPPAAAPPKASPAAPPKAQQLKGRAIAVGGAVIVSQDGQRARYRMLCKTCGHQDSACNSLMITNKTFKRNFFCPKCRKRRDVIIQCQMR